VTAAEALAKARAALDCENSTGFNNECPTLREDELPYEGDNMVASHRTWASACLDGFSVEDLTELGA
jgi:hypothetical protein